MGKTMFQTCCEIVKAVRAKGYKDAISWSDLLPFIREMAGSSTYTMKAYRKELMLSGLLKSDNAFVFKLTDKAKKLI